MESRARENADIAPVPSTPVSGERDRDHRSASRWLAETPASSKEIKVAPAARIKRIPALEATVAEWQPIPMGAEAPLSAQPSGAAPVLSIPSISVSAPPPPVSAQPPVSRATSDALKSVGLAADVLIDRTYRVERSLGVGGMGVVALAVDERLDRKVAIKFIKPELFAFPEMRTFFHNEARAMARVSHPNVLQVYAFGEHEGTPYFVMEYVDGKTADHWLRARSANSFPDLDQALKILEQACMGVEAIHATGTVHRDLKPSNLLIDQQFRVSVGDLGVARILESAASANFVVGSASYMAPESALGEDEGSELAHLRDIYALGCIAYELFTGQPPFSGATDMNVLSQHVLADPKRPSEVRPDLPPGFDDILLRALAKDPLQRYQSVAAFRRALVAERDGVREPERILIADDDDDWRSIIVGALRARFPDAVIDEVHDGEAALAAFDKKTYSVALVDLEMPEIDGARLTLLLRSIDGLQRTPIIVLTAAGGPREWQRLSAMGADAFLVKPVNADDVELVIRRTMRSRQSTPRPAPATVPAPPAL